VLPAPIVVVEQSVNVALSIADRAIFAEKDHVRFEAERRRIGDGAGDAPDRPAGLVEVGPHGGDADASGATPLWPPKPLAKQCLDGY
jgi:hypothetical protein